MKLVLYSLKPIIVVVLVFFATNLACLLLFKDDVIIGLTFVFEDNFKIG